MKNKQEIIEAMSQLTYLTEMLSKHCRIDNEDILKDVLKALGLAMDVLEKEYRSAIADIVTVRSEYVTNNNYSDTDIEIIKVIEDIIATNIGKKLLEDNLIDFNRMSKCKTTIGGMYTYRGEIEVAKSNTSLEYIQLSKAVVEGFNKGFNEAEIKKQEAKKATDDKYWYNEGLNG